MGKRWVYHCDMPQGKIVNEAEVSGLLIDGWVLTPRDLPLGLFFGNDGTSTASMVPLVDAELVAPVVVPVIEPVIPVVDDTPDEDEDARYKDMTRPEMFAILKNTYGETMPANSRRDILVDKLKELEGVQ